MPRLYATPSIPCCGGRHRGQLFITAAVGFIDDIHSKVRHCSNNPIIQENEENEQSKPEHFPALMPLRWPNEHQVGAAVLADRLRDPIGELSVGNLMDRGADGTGHPHPEHLGVTVRFMAR